MSTRTWSVRKDPILWGALGCALVGTAHAEYTLALSVGANPWVAGAVPGALDLYVIRTLQQGRDVLLSVLVMVAANVASYLVHSGDVPVDWRLRSAVGALAPLILWRVYSLKRTRTRSDQEERQAYSGTGSAPEYGPSAFDPRYGCIWGHAECEDQDGCTVYSGTDTPVLGPDGYGPLPRRLHLVKDESAPEDECTAPDSVPEWMSLEVHADAGAPEGLLPGDEVHLDDAGVYLAAQERPSIRGLKDHLKVGQPKATRIFNHLMKEEKGS